MLEWWLSQPRCCGSKAAGAKWYFAIVTLGTAIFPLADFVSDIIVTYDFYTAEDPAEQYWGKLSLGIIISSSLLNLAWFWLFADIYIPSQINQNTEGDFMRHRLWSASLTRNALIGFVLTVTNVRAQAIACILLWRVMVHGKKQKDLDMKDRRGFGSVASTKSLTFIKLFEFFLETKRCVC